MPAPTLTALKRYAIARSLFKPTHLPQAIKKLGFVQADPIRAPARAQDLTLRLRVLGYQAGDLERRYAELAIEEDCLVNYGFLPRDTLKLMHPRVSKRSWDAATQRHADALLAHVRTHGPTQARDLPSELDLGLRKNAWGGQGKASTHLLDGLHYRGLLRVKTRAGGQRIYEAVQHTPDARSDSAKALALVEVVLRKYAPLPARSLSQLARFLGYGAPHLMPEIKRVLAQASAHFPNAVVEGHTWFWPEGENPAAKRWELDETLSLLAPFDPVVWDRLRFETFWGWPYRFEAYTPAPKRQLGYYALPLLWRGEVQGWANVSVLEGRLVAQRGERPEAKIDTHFKRAWDAELERLAVFLGVQTP